MGPQHPVLTTLDLWCVFISPPRLGDCSGQGQERQEEPSSDPFICTSFPWVEDDRQETPGVKLRCVRGSVFPVLETLSCLPSVVL